jgi:RIO kinase 1
MFRNLRNDAMYRQGREVLTADGSAAGKQAGTIARAIRNKTTFGMEAAHTSWLMHEFTAMEMLYKAGAAVPQPIAANGNTVLMAYLGDELLAAPTLNTVRLEREEAEVLFREMVRNIDLLLQHELIHGDLSAFNILYWQGQITIIDFPQIVNLYANPKARFILERDVQRTCEYFGHQGLDIDANALTTELWRRYVPELDPEDRAADESRLELQLAELLGEPQV